MKKRKINILTFHRAHNYGAVLQAFALNKWLIKKGNNCTVLDYKSSVFDSYRLFHPLRKNIIKFLLTFIKDLKEYKINKIRHKKFESFIKQKIQLEEYDNKKINADILICGSDQVWNSKITAGLQDEYTLNIGEKNIKRISYAPSIGSIDNIKENPETYKNKLNIIDKMSVREESAKEELSKIFPNKSIEVVLDPTLLLTKLEWEEEIKDIPKIKEKYILAYIVEKNEEHTKIVNELSEKTGLKVLFFEKDGKYKNSSECVYSSGPLEFISLIKNAEYIVATSFHATVFSIIFNKKFWIVPHKTTGARVVDLLKKLQLSNRIVYSLKEFKKIDYSESIDYSKINDILKTEIKKSEDWLQSSIEK